ncbi:hypothetical protein ZHAS_00008740 [Anopheles sinensis]|uniref:Uncharacterized protein n=1 Tax=Anopheles sinensis TaxID=74873 RepID=A0A084VT84_ANOSI|nr:hypothetical protein ZHAS_00008740 [Anopheles sinensis]
MALVVQQERDIGGRDRSTLAVERCRPRGQGLTTWDGLAPVGVEGVPGGPRLDGRMMAMGSDGEGSSPMALNYLITGAERSFVFVVRSFTVANWEALHTGGGKSRRYNNSELMEIRGWIAT